jgi:hypothetical protein
LDIKITKLSETLFFFHLKGSRQQIDRDLGIPFMRQGKKAKIVSKQAIFNPVSRQMHCSFRSPTKGEVYHSLKQGSQIQLRAIF